MIELKQADFAKARPLFEPLMAYHLFCAGVLEGRYPGRVFVDDVDQPQSAFAVKDGVWWYLAGDPCNEAFNRALNAAIFDRTIGDENAWGGMLFCHPDDWRARLPMIFAPREPIESARRHYTCRTMQFDWRSQIPAGFDVRFVDQTLAVKRIKLPEPLENVLAARAGADDPDGRAIGFAALYGGQIAAFAVIDCIVNREGDIGLETEEVFRRRGLAAVTSAAVIDYALTHGITKVHWDCMAYNLGSVRAAEKLGLQFEHEHTMYSLAFDEGIHDINLAWSYADAGRYAQALEVCRRQGDEARPSIFYLMARAYAGLGQPEAAIQALAEAVKRGWDTVEETQTALAALQSRPEWDGLMKQIQENGHKSVEA